MNILIIILIATLWITIGGILVAKADWWKTESESDARVLTLFTIMFAPLVLISDIINRTFIQKWH